MSASKHLRWVRPDAVIEALEGIVSNVPTTRVQPAADPASAARALARKAATRAAAVSGALALPPGVLGMVTVVPDLVAIWRLQAQMVADIAGLFGREVELTRAHMVYCLFRHAASQAVRDIAVRTGERIVMRHLSQAVLRGVLAGVGVSVTRRVAGSLASRWLPIAGAGAVAAYAYYDTLQVAKTAIKVLDTPVAEAAA